MLLPTKYASVSPAQTRTSVNRSSWRPIGVAPCNSDYSGERENDKKQRGGAGRNRAHRFRDWMLAGENDRRGAEDEDHQDVLNG